MNTSNQALRILAVGAHPDDLEFGCGGVLLKELTAGAEISIAVCSLGESGSNGTAEVREAEMRAAAEMLEASDRLQVFDFGGDGKQRDTPENTVALASLIRQLKPNVVLAPTLTVNQHPDHSVVGRLTQKACRLARYGGLQDLRELSPHRVNSLWFYAVASPLEQAERDAILVDVSAEIERWEALMQCHRSQVESRAYLDMQKTQAHRLGLLAGCEYAIALWPNDPPVVDRIGPLSQTARAY